MPPEPIKAGGMEEKDSKMTDEQLTAGPELDARIAREVFGWPYTAVANSIAHGIVPGGNQMTDEYSLVPNYSGRIARAIQVRNAMLGRHNWSSTIGLDGLSEEVCFRRGMSVVSRETPIGELALCICLAALDALASLKASAE